jgi:glutamine synthetase
METLQKIGLRHNLVCLTHEKPFTGVNGSGKHNNWSMVTDDGINLLEPGSTPHDNMVFLVVLCAVVRAVDKYAKLLRASVATAGNDHRLGANEAPPAIVSVFLGDQLTDIVEQLAAGGAQSSKAGGHLKLGVSTLPPLPKDCTDRNRTSPFAFTGNKFEFRMVGSSQSTAGPMFVVNTIVADVLKEIADELEKSANIKADVQKILQKIAKEHRKIIFNGDNYTEQWAKEAAKRGLPNIKSTVESLNTIMDTEHVKLFESHNVLSKAELNARTEILLEAYSMIINIEAKTTLNIAQRQILPAAIGYSGQLAETVKNIDKAGADASTQKKTLDKVCQLAGSLNNNIEELKKAVTEANNADNSSKKAQNCRDSIIPAMDNVRQAADGLEMIVDAKLWPLPSYAEMLFMK